MTVNLYADTEYILQWNIAAYSLAFHGHFDHFGHVKMYNLVN